MSKKNLLSLEKKYMIYIISKVYRRMLLPERKESASILLLNGLNQILQKKIFYWIKGDGLWVSYVNGTKIP